MLLTEDPNPSRDQIIRDEMLNALNTDRIDLLRWVDDFEVAVFSHIDPMDNIFEITSSLSTKLMNPNVQTRDIRSEIAYISIFAANLLDSIEEK